MNGKLGKLPATADERDITFKAIRARLTIPTPPANFGHGTIYHDGEGASDWQMNGNGPDDSVAPGFQGPATASSPAAPTPHGKRTRSPDTPSPSPAKNRSPTTAPSPAT